jgi:pyruvate/2-oxoglutarate dehydrogenase complex dihydrolipoamide dehydrogenase (E3) component
MHRSNGYNLICIGSGPAGQRAAIQAAKLGKKVAVVEKKQFAGGICIETGTIPSKTFREASPRLLQPGLEIAETATHAQDAPPCSSYRRVGRSSNARSQHCSWCATTLN